MPFIGMFPQCKEGLYLQELAFNSGLTQKVLHLSGPEDNKYFMVARHYHLGMGVIDLPIR